ncbi:unnamed protein product [Malus baccata var. baccata]
MQSLRSIFVCLFLLSFLRISSAATLGTITPSQYIRDGETLVSAGGGFELGFFSPGNSKGRYLGIWYTVSADTVVWVANRETPLGDSSGFLKLSKQGVLVLLNSSDNIVWSSNSSRTVGNPVSQLLDTGNLIVKDGNETNSDNFSWQSFDYPCDTFLPEMKLGWDLASGLERYVSSWKSTENPAPGDFSLRITHWGLPQLVTMKGAKIQARGGSWNGVHFTGYGSSGIRNSNPLPGVEFRLNKNEIYYEYRLLNRSEFSRYVLNPLGITQRFTWVYQTQSWELSFTFQADQCENYALCGAYATCNINNAPICACLKGFAPKSPKDWNSGYWSGGCVRKTPLACSHGDGFLKYNGIKLPDTSTSWFNKSMSLKECKGLCLENCSCTAYANLDIRVGGSGCLLWFGNLIDIREFAISDVQDLYIRMTASELVRRKDFRKEYLGEDRELPLFDLTTIAKATDNFSSSNKLGEGGFGPVYKGTLMGGKEVAVKRLSKDSGQGMREFKNEVKMIARLQHRNLVKLLGCCTQEDEKILIYEFMPNRSLDFFVFDEEGRNLLNWPKCFHIIGGIARGLVYLHHDSRLRVIHRDLKASNILLDNNLNPKIADFGLAKIFDSDQSQASTNRVVGTYGYMSPEYAVDGIFSMKSDVFSFGVILLEMLCRKKNRGFCHPDHHLNLLGHAWMLWMQDKQLELIDKTLSDSCNIYEVVRCLHVGLLCVQKVPEDRPSMSSVVLMLSSDVALPSPKQPGFYTERSVSESPSSKRPCSENDVSISLIEPR